MAHVATPRTFLTIAQVADELQLSRSTIKRKLAAGEIPFVKLGSGPKSAVRIDRAELEDWLFSAPAVATLDGRDFPGDAPPQEDE